MQMQQAKINREENPKSREREQRPAFTLFLASLWDKNAG